MDHFPTEEECDRVVRKDEDVKFYSDHEIDISYNNIHEYNA